MSEFTDKLRGWAADDRAQADAKREALPVTDAEEQEAVMRWFSGLADSDAKREQIEAQAQAFKQAAHANETAAKTLDSVATAWETLAKAFDDAEGVDDPDLH